MPTINKLIERYKELPVQVKASFWFLICAFLQKGISTITTPIFTRLLSTAEYGQYSVFNSWLGIVTIFVSLSLAGGVYTQGLIKYDSDRKIFSSSLQGLTLSLVVAWTVVYLLFQNFWNTLFSLTTIQMLSMLVMIWMSSAFNFWAAEQRVLYNYRILVLITFAVSITKPLIGIIFVLNAEDKVTARILGLVLVELIGYMGLFVSQMRKGKVFYSSRYWKYALMFNLPLIPHYLSQSVLSSADRIMINKMVGADEAGIYSLAYSISQIMTLFNNAIIQTINPWIYQKIKDNKIKDISNIAYIVLMLIAGVNLLLIAFAPEAVAIFAPESYYDAIWVIPPIAMSVYFLFCYDLFAKFAFYYEKTGFVMIASTMGAVLNIILNYIFIGLYGYYAAGYTTLFCYVIYAIGHYLFMIKVCDEFCNGIRPYNIKHLIKITIAFLGCGFCLLASYNNVFIRYGIILFVTVVIFAKRKYIWNNVEQVIQTRKKA